MDLDLLYDNSPHDGLDTPFQPGTKTTWCVNFLLGACPYEKLCGHRHGQVVGQCIDYLVSGLIREDQTECQYGDMCPWKDHGGHTPVESSSREIASRRFTKLEADRYKRVQGSNTWPENVFSQGYWRSDGYKDQWVEGKPHLYYLSGTSGTGWPKHSWKCREKPCPEKYQVAPLIVDESGSCDHSLLGRFHITQDRSPVQGMMRES